MTRRTHAKSNATELGRVPQPAQLRGVGMQTSRPWARTRTAADPAAVSPGPALPMSALVLIVLGLISAVIAGALFFTANIPAASHECTWGASSIVVADGKVIAGPDVTGCVP
jgi:hypothetical protein